MAQNLPPHTTLTYKEIEGENVLFDLYQPQTFGSNTNIDHHGNFVVPAVVYFHAGGLTVGNRTSWFPHWLHRRVVGLGVAFLCPDHQLLPPATGHDILSDIKDFLAFIGSENTIFEVTAVNPLSQIKYKIDANAIVLAGSSAGGLCAYLAAGAFGAGQPKLKGIISMYGMGGDFMIPYWIEIKHDIFVPGREMLDPEDFKEFVHPFLLPVTTTSELQYHPDDHPTPGLPANPRMKLARLYCQFGTYLDYYTGEHEPSLSETLRRRREAMMKDDALNSVKPLPTEEWSKPLVPERHRILFPQFSITPEWPEVFLIHGTDDHLVHIHESQHLGHLLEEQNVKVTLKTVAGKGHSFDYAPGAEEEFKRLFDEVGEYLRRVLKL